eukprot:3942772-Amphidinium_carterae.1
MAWFVKGDLLLNGRGLLQGGLFVKGGLMKGGLCKTSLQLKLCNWGFSVQKGFEHHVKLGFVDGRSKG